MSFSDPAWNRGDARDVLPVTLDGLPVEIHDPVVRYAERRVATAGYTGSQTVELKLDGYVH